MAFSIRFESAIIGATLSFVWCFRQELLKQGKKRLQEYYCHEQEEVDRYLI
ncbi:hypothetical protein HSB1_46260 [Halogranum salarium B-1]|uniref:Uncharacterized protein n=1 Tax=Halogranum salarium B-1 TaxID=1210908 RepID=J2Z9D4_9EURY|nr:hypothetical protein HSB1_46260 [Halogranum salarium B-1]